MVTCEYSRLWGFPKSRRRFVSLTRLSRPHNGRNLTAQDFADAVSDGLNVEPTFGSVPAQAFMKGSGKTYFDLKDLNQPGVLQHISSLTRDDLNDDWSNTGPVPSRIAALLDDSETDYIDVKSLGKSRLRVESLSLPDTLTVGEQGIAYTESGLVLLMMTERDLSPGVWEAPKDRVSTWLSEERLPTEHGWERSERLILSSELAPIVAGITSEYCKLEGALFCQS